MPGRDPVYITPFTVAPTQSNAWILVYVLLFCRQGIARGSHSELQVPSQRVVLHRIPLPLGSALGRARLEPRVVCRLLAVPRVALRVEPRVGAEYFEVCLEDTVLGGFSTKVVSVVLEPEDESVQVLCEWFCERLYHSQESHLALVSPSRRIEFL